MKTNLVAALVGFLLSGCAVASQTVALSPRNPADPAAPEGVSPPLPSLMEGALPTPQQEPETPAGEMSHEHHHGEPPASPEVLYTCPMHPQVQQDHPGACPVCGMALVKKQPQREEDGR